MTDSAASAPSPAAPPRPSPQEPPAGRLTATDRWLALGLALVALYLFGWGIGDYPLLDPWEPKYAQALRDMGERGDFVTPYLNGKIRWTKPILVYWLMAGPVAVFGNNEVGVRLAPVLTGVAGVVLLFYFLRVLRGRATALIGAAVLMTLPQYFYIAREAVPDMPLNLCLLGAMAFFALARLTEWRKGPHLILFYAAIALGFLTKGPLAPVLTGFALALVALPDLEPRRLLSLGSLFGDLRSLWTRYRVGRGLAIMAAIGLPWYAIMLVRHGGVFVDSFIYDENISRFAEPLFGHTGKITHYVNTMFYGMFPWFCLLPAGLPFLFAGRDSLDERGRLAWYAWAWLVANFLLFTMAGTKLDHYILPATPAVAVIVALLWEAYFEDPQPFWFRPALVISMGLMVLVIKDFVVESNRYLMTVFLPAQDIELGWEAIDLELKILAVAWLVLLSLAWFVPRSRVLAALICLAALGNGIFYSHVALPAHAPERSLAAYAERFERTAEPDAELLFFGWMRYSIIYYSDKPVMEFEPEQAPEMIRYVRDRSPVYIVVQTEYLDDLLEDLHLSAPARWTLVSDEHPLFSLISNTGKRRLRKRDSDPGP